MSAVGSGDEEPSHQLCTVVHTWGNEAWRVLQGVQQRCGCCEPCETWETGWTRLWTRAMPASMPVSERGECEAQTTRLADLRVVGTTPIIFINAAYMNKGRQDDKSLGAAAAVLYYEGKEWGHTEHVSGDRVTRSDVGAAPCPCPAKRLPPVVSVLQLSTYRYRTGRSHWTLSQVW